MRKVLFFSVITLFSFAAWSSLGDESNIGSELNKSNVEALSGDENGNQRVARCKGNCCICAKDNNNEFIIHGHAQFID